MNLRRKNGRDIKRWRWFLRRGSCFYCPYLNIKCPCLGYSRHVLSGAPHALRLVYGCMKAWWCIDNIGSFCWLDYFLFSKMDGRYRYVWNLDRLQIYRVKTSSCPPVETRPKSEKGWQKIQHSTKTSRSLIHSPRGVGMSSYLTVPFTPPLSYATAVLPTSWHRRRRIIWDDVGRRKHSYL